MNSWQPLTTLEITQGWQLTPLTDARFFRLRYAAGQGFTHIVVAQAQDLEQLELFGQQRLLVKADRDILELPAPAFFTERCLAVRGIGYPTLNPALTLTLHIEVNDTPQTDLATVASALQALSSQVDQRLDGVETWQALTSSQLSIILEALEAPEPEPEPEPEPPSNSAAGVPYVASQRSAYGGTTGTYANLTDGDGTTGACNGGESRTWIKATYSQPVQVSSVRVGGGQIATAGLIAATGALNVAKLQYSTDDATWVDSVAISGVTDSGADQFKTFTLPTPITAQYWRLESQSYLATTEFKLE